MKKRKKKGKAARSKFSISSPIVSALCTLKRWNLSVRYYALIQLLNRVRSQASSLSLTESLTVHRPPSRQRLGQAFSRKFADVTVLPSKTACPDRPFPSKRPALRRPSECVPPVWSWLNHPSSPPFRNRYITGTQFAQCAAEKWISITPGRSIAFLFSFTGIKGQPDYRATRSMEPEGKVTAGDEKRWDRGVGLPGGYKNRGWTEPN